MTSHWNTVQPTVLQFDGRIFQVPDHVAYNWMHSGSACAHIKYCFCAHPDLVQAASDHWQYDDFWHEFVPIASDERP
jgi:hypothetical protein